MYILYNKEGKVKKYIFTFTKKAHRKDKLAAKSQGLSIWKIKCWSKLKPDCPWVTLVFKYTNAFFSVVTALL